MTFSKLSVTLSNEQGQSTDLQFNIIKSKAAQIWADCILKALKSGLNESERFYGFPKQDKSDLTFLLNELAATTQKLKILHPELDFPEIDKGDVQKSVNRLHFEFAHSHHVTKRINAENEKIWSAFNVNLHAIENVFTDQISMKKNGLPLSRIVFTWNEPNRVDIPDDCYSDFTYALEFGTVYINYSQVGRHFFELFHANDNQLADEHIRPFRYISADTHLYFGPTTVDKYIRIGEKIAKWFDNNKEKFNRLGFFWGDPKLAIGYLPVARLQNLPKSSEEKLQFVEFLSQFKKVHSVQLA